jgi:hypothetical protein
VGEDQNPGHFGRHLVPLPEICFCASSLVLSYKPVLSCCCPTFPLPYISFFPST